MPSLPPSEQFLRFVWQEQVFRPGSLTTAEGMHLEILTPGILNTDGGPDFQDAIIIVGGRRFCGDVELHTDASAWNRHGHAGDPHYNRVILHVVLARDKSRTSTSTAAGRSVPVVAVGPFLREGAVEEWRLRRRSGDFMVRLRCFPSNECVPEQLIRAWLVSLGRQRFRMRVDVLRERLGELARDAMLLPGDRESGCRRHPVGIRTSSSLPGTEKCFPLHAWDQLLYESVMEALGYEKNRTAFVRLARAIRLDALRLIGIHDPLTIQAVLFGASGLLPKKRLLREPESRRYVQALKSRWKELRPFFRVPMLHEGDWLFFRLRPGNFPTARLATAAFLLPRLFHGGTFGRLIALLAAAAADARPVWNECRDLFSIEPDEFWSHHRHFRQEVFSGRVALGPDRITDVMINSIAPVAWLYAEICEESRLKQGLEALLDVIPTPPPNAITRTIERDLLSPPARCNSIFLSQGSLQLFTRYCREERCAECVIEHALNTPRRKTRNVSEKTFGGSCRRSVWKS